MDLQFNQSVMKYLRTAAREYQTQEQTQEIRIPDGMPDIGMVLACWGQPVLRGKEWRSDHVGVTGGVMAKILYLPEDGAVPQVVECWIPFQMKWSIPNERQDGTMTVELGLRSADARVLSARKLMVRVNVGVMMHAMIFGECTVFHPVELPEDVQLLTNTYTLALPKETGEKVFTLDENLEFSPSEPKPEQVVHIGLFPQILEQKVLSDKLIFRGLCLAHLLYRSADGQLHARDFDLPFSQYTDLEGEFDPEATMQVFPVVTNVELEQTPEGMLHLKASVSGQYLIYDRVQAELAQDAYSPVRTVEVTTERLLAPTLLEYTRHPVSVHLDAQVDVMRPVDVAFWPEQPYVSGDDRSVEADMGGVFQMLYYDPEGQLQSTQSRWSDTQQLPVPPDADCFYSVVCNGKPQYSGGTLSAELLTDITAIDSRGIDMICALTLGDQMEHDPERPSVMIAKAGKCTLWELAKANGTTVELIRQANNLSAEPAPDTVLLMPIKK